MGNGKRTTRMFGFEITSNGLSVWVKSDEGHCVGHFSRSAAQVFPTPPSSIVLSSEKTQHDGKDWARFKAMISDHCFLEIPDSHEPIFSQADKDENHLQTISCTPIKSLR